MQPERALSLISKQLLKPATPLHGLIDSRDDYLSRISYYLNNDLKMNPLAGDLACFKNNNHTTLPGTVFVHVDDSI